MGIDTTSEAADIATERGALPLRSLTLIGVMGTEAEPRALLRTPGGQIRHVRVGDAVRQGTVVAITEDALTLAARNGATTVMHMPARAEVRPAA